MIFLVRSRLLIRNRPSEAKVRKFLNRAFRNKKFGISPDSQIDFLNGGFLLDGLALSTWPTSPTWTTPTTHKEQDKPGEALKAARNPRTLC